MTEAVIDVRARTVIERCAVNRRFLETGGSLFGWKDETGGIVVACATGPGPGAKHRPSRFAPARSTVQTTIDRVADASRGRYTFVGSWHTHPLARPLPSTVDQGTAFAMSEQEDLQLPRPLLLILSTTGSARNVTVREFLAWVWNPKTRTLDEASVSDIQLAERYCPCAEMLFTE